MGQWRTKRNSHDILMTEIHLNNAHPLQSERHRPSLPPRSNTTHSPSTNHTAIQHRRICHLPPHRFAANQPKPLFCHAGNLRRVPLVVLAVVLDDDHHNTDESKVVMTSRRLAFTLQALSYACEQWSKHGAAVGI